MNCDDARKRLHEAADGQMDGALRTHLFGCEPCQAELKRYKDAWALLLSSPDVAPSGDFLPGLRAKLPGRRSRILRYAAPIAAAAAAFLIVFSSMFRPTPPSAYIDEEIGRMSPEDRALFQALEVDNTWELAEQYDLVHSMDAVSGDWPPAEERK